MAKICPRCGYYNSNVRKTCALCETPLDEKNAPTVQRKYSFYHVQAANRRNSVILFIVLAAILIVLGYFIGQYFNFGMTGLVIAVAVAIISGISSYYGGKSIVMAISGAKRADRDKDREIVNIAEEISIAAGLPAPEVYIIETPAMNAFATGRDPRHAAIAVTRGLAEKLNREELTGVIAHEMSHVRHLDIRFAMMISVLVGSIVLISDFALRFLFLGGRGSRRRKEGGNGGAIILLVVLVLAIISPLLAKIIQMSVSRKRELMADAGAAELTRNPDALANALEKISMSDIKLVAASRATQHMFIINPLKKVGEKSKSLFSTHPPVESRIRILRSM